MSTMDENGENKEGGGEFPSKEHQFKPGHPGGPGRPKKGKLTRLLEKELDKAGADGETEALKLMRSVIKRAKAGNASLVKEILERVEGKVPMAHLLGGIEGASPIQVEEQTLKQILASEEGRKALEMLSQVVKKDGHTAEDGG